VRPGGCVMLDLPLTQEWAVCSGFVSPVCWPPCPLVSLSVCFLYSCMLPSVGMPVDPKLCVQVIVCREYCRARACAHAAGHIIMHPAHQQESAGLCG
jgi:hypothetical protein